MQVILLETIGKVGQLGDVVRVRNGYARNYLIPQGKAQRATDAAIKEFEARRAELEKAQADRVAAAEALANKLADYKLDVTQKAGVDGRLFGSVTNIDIARLLEQAGFEVERSQVRMPDGALKAVGEYPVTIHLYADIAANITVNVIGEMA
ncbi:MULTISPECIES: 50S ribosomal protein L9 [Oligella]|uniref:Large ribosomal subunit protein bL9 n=2 Tax=Oligella urethralis TaxID=90245 RepID=A0A095Z3D3_9BURK|nr:MULTISPECIES: 50S ribosomal protein L9 [Oligella]AVL71174.1 50S ribosomal protein L9 [Oligella urethralis]KGF28846.1 50S ribosomal protein L9 [Oligella urethralis DNF00040]MDK6202630.1 50S ribosomal protein L9 [Oligella urethralis]OFS83329.1 50S ribosomal protein L9 [Oligella sp. HMSC05A10]OFV48852.1 50S ribosomal protein L9 [Oligella sp. HMSC09E12]